MISSESNLNNVKEEVKNEVCNQLDIVKNMLMGGNDIDSMKWDGKIDKPNNRIIFGAPGTGKSHRIKQDIEIYNLRGLFKRVTFHPNYTYSQFVGSYKPISKNVTEGDIKKEVISYEFVPGPFLKVLLDALKDEKNGVPHILVIEEINRANPAAVFGDVFQLLDRNSQGQSSYTINMSDEMKKYVCKELGKDIEELYIPNNMYIWSTMNSADQGVYPMDSAFKRRWSFEYIGIDENEEQLKGKAYEFIQLKNEDGDYTSYEWNKVRTTINKKLKNGKVNEDKLLGPFFLSKTELLKSKEDTNQFDTIFKSKVLMYLYEDILKHKKIDFFVGDVQTLSDIMNAYDAGKVFNFEIEKSTGVTYQLKEDREESEKVAEDQSPFDSKE
ncbi:AAA family ATPase [Clostridium sp.]|uniref:AAA family ATPase n=1 Tax=Clostridium sp. TaxID=1506 RepID=UPI00321726E9